MAKGQGWISDKALALAKRERFGKPASRATISVKQSVFTRCLNLERLDMFKKIDNYRSTIQKIYCRQADS